jgi:hypothetical protein
MRAGYYRQKVAEASSEPKKMWRIAKSLLHTAQRSDIRGADESQRLADSFATFFSQKLSDIRNKVIANIALCANHSTNLTIPTMLCLKLGQRQSDYSVRSLWPYHLVNHQSIPS